MRATLATVLVSLVALQAACKSEPIERVTRGAGDATPRTDPPSAEPEADGAEPEPKADGQGDGDADVPTGDGEGDGDAPQDEPVDDTPAPDSLVRSLWYGARYAPASLTGIRPNGTNVVLGAQLRRRIEERLTTTVQDGQLFSETYGDGQGRRVTTVDLVSSAADFGINPGETSESGSRYHFLAPIDACPEALACAERIVVKPYAGDETTLCFATDAGEPTLFPTGPKHGAKAADFAEAYGTYGPFTVSAFAGGDVDCADPAAAPLFEEQVRVVVAEAAVAALPLQMHTVEPLPLQFGVSFETRREARDNQTPYVDETTGLKLRQLYAFNEDKGVLVKQVTTSRQSIDASQAAGGGLLGGLVGLFNNVSGIAVELHFELCQDRLDKTAPLWCPAVAE